MGTARDDDLRPPLRPASDPPVRPASRRAPDDTDLGWGDWREADWRSDEEDRDSWYCDQRPPHHGD